MWLERLSARDQPLAILRPTGYLADVSSRSTTIVTPKVLLVPTIFVLAAVQVTSAVQAAQKPDNQDNRDWNPN
jgi:hypothetical protein